MALDQGLKDMSEQALWEYQEKRCHVEEKSWCKSCLVCLGTMVEALKHGADLIYANLSFPFSDAFAIKFCLANLHEKSNMVYNMKAMKSTIIILSLNISIK